MESSYDSSPHHKTKLLFPPVKMKPLQHPDRMRKLDLHLCTLTLQEYNLCHHTVIDMH